MNKILMAGSKAGLALASAAMLSMAAPSFAQQDWPNKPVRIISAGGPGGTVDQFIRIFAEPLQKKYGQPFLADYRPGGGGRIATEAMAKAPPDGYLLGAVAGAGNVVVPLLVKSVPTRSTTSASSRASSRCPITSMRARALRSRT